MIAGACLASDPVAPRWGKHCASYRRQREPNHLRRWFACGARATTAQSFVMTMTPTRMRECLALPAWSLRELGRRLGIDDGSARQMARGKRPISDNLADWLELVAAAWMPLTPDLRIGAGLMGCDRGKYVRHPVNFRPLSPAEAAQLELLAAFHRQHPRPVGWNEGSHGSGGQ